MVSETTFGPAVAMTACDPSEVLIFLAPIVEAVPSRVNGQAMQVVVQAAVDGSGASVVRAPFHHGEVLNLRRTNPSQHLGLR